MYKKMCTKLLHTGILIEFDSKPGKLRLHSLFSIVARESNFGVKDKKALARLVDLRRQVYWRYTFAKALELLRSSKESGWREVIPQLIDEFPDFLAAIMTGFDAEITTDEQLRSFEALCAPSTVLFILMDRLYQVRHDVRHSYVQVLKKVLERCLSMGKDVLLDPNFFNFTCNRAQRLANFALPSRHCTSLEDINVYISLVEGLCKIFEQKHGEGTPLVFPHLMWPKTTTTIRMIDLGHFEKARPIFEEILQVEPPEELEAQVRKGAMLQALLGWLSALQNRYKQLSSVLQLLHNNDSIQSILLDSGACTQERVDKLCALAKQLLQSTFHELLSQELPLSLPKRGKYFDSQFQEAYAGANSAIQISAAIEVNPVSFDLLQREKALKKVNNGYKLHNAYSGDPRGALGFHQKLWEMALAGRDWKAAIDHLNKFTQLDMTPRTIPHLIYTLCFAKLKIFDAARLHAVTALEVALQTDNEVMLPVVYGTLAGLEFGRRSHFSALPKMLLLQGIAKNYMTDKPTETQLRNQSGMLLSLLCFIISLQNIPWELGINPDSFPQFSTPYQALSKWESEVDNLLTLIEGSIEFLLRIRSDGVATGGNYRTDLYNEAEHIVFSKDKPKTDNFGTDGWTRPFCNTRPNSDSSEVTQTFWDVIDRVPITDDLLCKLLGLGKGKIAIRYDVPAAETTASDSDSTDEDSDETEKAWDSSRFFHEKFLEELLIPAQARDHDIGKEMTAWMLARTYEGAADVGTRDLTAGGV